MTNWTKLPALQSGEAGLRSGCSNCGPQPITQRLDARMAVGFGAVEVTRDGEPIWNGDDDERTLAGFEELAERDPDHDWRAAWHGPLSDAVYQRHGPGQWVLVQKGQGFA